LPAACRGNDEIPQTANENKVRFDCRRRTDRRKKGAAGAAPNPLERGRRCAAYRSGDRYASHRFILRTARRHRQNEIPQPDR